MIHEFDAQLVKLPGKIQWTVFYVPFNVKEVYDTNGRINVKVTIDGNSFKGKLLPSKNGHYFVYNKQIEKQCKKTLDDTLHVVMEKDEDVQNVEIPDFITLQLQENQVLDVFNELPNYIKREEINKICNAKKEETKQRRMEKLIVFLKNNH